MLDIFYHLTKIFFNRPIGTLKANIYPHHLEEVTDELKDGICKCVCFGYGL